MYLKKSVAATWVTVVVFALDYIGITAFKSGIRSKTGSAKGGLFTSALSSFTHQHGGTNTAEKDTLTNTAEKDTFEYTFGHLETVPF